MARNKQHDLHTYDVWETSQGHDVGVIETLQFNNPGAFEVVAFPQEL